MAYIQKPPTFEAVQWGGENIDECVEFRLRWFEQAPQMPGGPVYPSVVHDENAQTLTFNPGGYVLSLGDWLVNGGTWTPDGSWSTQPSMVTDAVFQTRFVEAP